MLGLELELVYCTHGNFKWRHMMEKITVIYNFKVTGGKFHPAQKALMIDVIFFDVKCLGNMYPIPDIIILIH